jgi:hypothetical protein
MGLNIKKIFSMNPAKMAAFSLAIFTVLINTSAMAQNAGGSTTGQQTFGDRVGNVFNAVGGVLNGVANFGRDVLGSFGTFFNDIGLGYFWNRFIGGILGYYDCGQITNGGLGQMFCNLTNNSSQLPGFVAAIAYLLGVYFAMVALFKLKEHVLNPDRAPLSDAIKRFVAGGLLFSLPSVVTAIRETLIGGKNMISPYDYGGVGFQVKASGGLDTNFAYFVADIWQPLSVGISAFGYIAGLVLTVVAISRLVKTAQEGAKGPAGFGTIMTFFTAGALFSLDSMMGAFSTSLFGSNIIRTYPTLSSGMTTGDEFVDVRIEGVLTSIIAFVAIVGWISFVRGFFIMRDAAEGNQQASIMAASTHLIAGAIAVNLGPFLMAVQSTFGIQGLLFN